MAFDYTKSVATARRLISNFGQSVTLRQSINVGTEYAPSKHTTPTTVTVVDLNQSRRDTETGSTVTTRKLLISTSAGVTPEKGDRVKLDGKWHKLGPVKTLAPGGTKILYTAEIES